MQTTLCLVAAIVVSQTIFPVTSTAQVREPAADPRTTTLRREPAVIRGNDIACAVRGMVEGSSKKLFVGPQYTAYGTWVRLSIMVYNRGYKDASIETIVKLDPPVWKKFATGTSFPGGKLAGPVRVSIPANDSAAVGPYYLVNQWTSAEYGVSAITDAPNEISETSEANNVCRIDLKLQMAV